MAPPASEMLAGPGAGATENAWSSLGKNSQLFSFYHSDRAVILIFVLNFSNLAENNTETESVFGFVLSLVFFFVSMSCLMYMKPIWATSTSVQRV